MTNLQGTDFILEVDTTTALTADRGTDANYRLIACLVTNGIEISLAEQSTSNKCDEGWGTSLSGMGTWSFSADGQAVSLESGEAATMANYQTLIDLALDKQIFFMRMTDSGNTVVREGKVRISAYSETAPNQEAYSFTATFTGIGKPFITPAV